MVLAGLGNSPIAVSVGIGTASPGYALDVATGSGQYTNAINVQASTHATSRRASMTTGNWNFGQDVSGNGTKDFYIYDGAAALTRFYISTSGNVGIGTASPSYTLHVVGTAGLSTGTAWTNASDIRLKDIRGDYEYGLNEVLQLHTVRYNYKKDNPLGLPSDFEKTGFIAQEVQKVIPDAVKERKDGYLELNVDPIHWAVVNAVKEFYAKWFADSAEKDRRLDEKDRQINELKSQNAAIKSENAAVRAYLCSKDPAAPICH